MEVNVRKLVVLGSREKRRKKRKKEKKKEKKRLAGKGKKRKEKAINRWADYTNRLRRDPFARIYQAFVISFFNLSSIFSTIVSRSFDTRIENFSSSLGLFIDCFFNCELVYSFFNLFSPWLKCLISRVSFFKHEASWRDFNFFYNKLDLILKKSFLDFNLKEYIEEDIFNVSFKNGSSGHFNQRDLRIERKFEDTLTSN